MGEATQVALACTCSEIRERDKLHMCIACHIYWINDKQLTSVSRILKDCFPATYDGVAPEVLENARIRGVQLDALVSAYVVGKLPETYPLGTQYDVIDLFDRFRDWWERKGFKANSQVVVHDYELAGTVDLIIDDTVWDLKCTYDVMPTHLLQVEGYADISGKAAGGIIHATKRYKEPRMLKVTTQTAYDWQTIRRFWRLKRRITN